ncbi:protein of unknown function DUF1113 [Coriobacterium glomerans PW2]|uniref:ABC transporter permease n=1 Tax=Coriobacterium glomerans (strain ATCC 49209 / DSM 20642 / JCM 10262 / PW2) TaxID=700015 RepID=F2N9B2_CORGP|nr:putative ABC transporter permease [Coriobacterium glomerans]AEB07860.1 protein of unknown function DUF1113 [Coriobacterium glomerans PW2]
MAGARKVDNELSAGYEGASEHKSLPLIIKAYGLLCLADGAFSLPSVSVHIGKMIWALLRDPRAAIVGIDPSLATVVAALALGVSVIDGTALVAFGIALLRNRRRYAGRVSQILIITTFFQIVLGAMMQGIGTHLIAPAIQLLILLPLSVIVDPALLQERRLQRRLRNMVERDAADEGMLGRDLDGRGYIQLNFFNLFWVFMVSSVLGLAIELAFHMLFVDPGSYQDRAGMLFGPFSPIYGYGAVLLTIALNRFYRSNFLIIFLVSALIGGLFEFAVSWFMQTAFGAVAWNYSDAVIFGVPDPVASLLQGRTSTEFMIMWGLLGLGWIRFCLPRLLRLINKIPWKMRYSLTTLCAVLMIINGVMTLQAIDCWFERISGIPPSDPVQIFYATYFDNRRMERRFQSMSINPEVSSRIDADRADRAVNSDR